MRRFTSESRLNVKPTYELESDLSVSEILVHTQGYPQKLWITQSERSLVAAVMLMFLATPVLSEPRMLQMQGRVVSVADGDTLTLLDGEKQTRIRLAEIDAPERGQPYSQKSKQSLLQMCQGKIATANVTGTDHYGRVIARVFCGNQDTSAEQVRLGLAWVYDQYAQDKQLYRLQEQAQSNKIGLWTYSNPVAPWEWRKRNR